jgi:uncharacterized protein YlzI (FlbEa/FlbD family)
MKMNGLARGVRISITMALGVVVFITSSYVVMAQVPFTGELLVSGNAVTVNGETSANGRTIVVPSNIVTGPGSYATLNFTNVGRIQVSPGTTFTVDGSGTTLRGSLSAGSVTLVNAVNPVTITLMCGKSVIAKTGDVVSYDAVCGAGTSPSQTAGTTAGKKSNSLLYLLLAGAAIGVVAAAAGGGGNGNGGGTTSGTT